MDDITGLRTALASLYNHTQPEGPLLKRLLQCDTPDLVRELYAYADTVRQRHAGDGVLVRGIVEFSSYCSRSCYYCGLNGTNTALKRYRLSDDEIFESIGSIAACGIKTVVLQSGEDPLLDARRLGAVIARIKSAHDMAVTLSVGERPREDYALWRAAGADRYLLKIETADKALYESMHPGMSFENRLRCLRDLRELGYQVGSGSIVGLKGQTIDALVRDICFFASMDFDMIGISPFIPHSSTPFASVPAGSVALVLKMLALTRIMTRNAHLPATTALGSVGGKDYRYDGLQSGANVLMPNFTPQLYQQQYEIYPGKRCISEAAGACLPGLENSLRSIGRFIDYSIGDSLKGSRT